VPLDEHSFAYAFRSSGGLTYRLKNDCENANTYAHSDVHFVMLAHLRMWWCLSGREGFGFLSPSRRAYEAGFSVFCGSETPIFYCAEREETEAKGSHWGDRTRDRTLDRTRLARPVSSSRVQRQRVHRHVRSVMGPARPVKLQRSCKTREVDRTRWRVRSRSTGRVRLCVGAYWNRPDAGTVASGQFKWRVQLHGQQRESAATGRCDRVRSVRLMRLVSTQAATTCS
jgi:hypothetical protein